MWVGEQWTLTRSEVIWKLPATSLCANLHDCKMLPTARLPNGKVALSAGEQWTLVHSEVIWNLPASSLCQNLCVCRMLPC